MAKLVRLKAHDIKKGHVLRRYTAFSTQFDEHRGWYRVSDEVAAYLATVHQVPNDEDTPLAFDVYAEADAQRIDLEEKKKAEQRAAAIEPHVAMPHGAGVVGGDLSTADLRDPGRRSRSSAAGGRRG
jgi:hypothetical protein